MTVMKKTVCNPFIIKTKKKKFRWCEKKNNIDLKQIQDEI